MKKLIGSMVDLLFPNPCCICGKVLAYQERFLCELCYYRLPVFRINDPADNALTRIFWGRVELEYGICLFRFSRKNAVSSLLHKMKYGNTPELAKMLGRLLGDRLNCLNLKFSGIAYVPLHPKKKKQRGYNQSEWISRGIADVTAWPILDLLERTHHADSQTRFGRLDRFKNIRNSYRLKHRRVSGHILLVDDVITTGATIETCASCLLEIKGVKISVASIAATVH